IDSSKVFSAFIRQGENGVESHADNNYIETLDGHYFNNITFGRNENISSLLSQVITAKKKQELLSYLNQFESHATDIDVIQNNRIVISDNRFPRGVDIGTYGGGFMRATHIFVNVLASEKGV